jgi:hypothetical protein
VKRNSDGDRSSNRRWPHRSSIKVTLKGSCLSMKLLSLRNP